MANFKSELRDLERIALQQGWVVERLQNNHIRFIPPNKAAEAVVVASTPSDHRVMKNFLSRLRRSGFKETVAA